jgi:putative acetyltransferase
VRIRPELAQDAGAVRTVHERAFAPSGAEADLVDALRGSGDDVPDLWLVAEEDGAVVGHIAFSVARLDGGAEVLALAPMGVLPGRQRAGIGSALVAEGLRRAAGTAYPLVVVLGHPEYYPRFGFAPAAAAGVLAPFPVPDEAWMIHRLPAYRRDARGTVAYADAFGAVT